MYHFSADNIAEPLVLSDRVHVPGVICQYMKPFQLRALRFLHTHYKKQETCIYNDESGLGKCATVAVFLGAIGRDRKILIVVQNDDDLVTGWQFHLSVLSNLAVTVITGNTDCTTSAYNVYIAKWCILKDIEDLSKFKFDYIVVDNRAQVLSNSFCVALLLKNYEKKVNLFMSSIDITLDLKQLHYVLRLCGRLDHQYLSWKSFDEKFNLPNVKDVAAKKVDLGEYFIKREIVIDFCKNFRLRQYRHQCGDLLPLVDVARYKNNLDTWLSEKNVKAQASQKSTETIVEVIESSGEKNTEELFEQYIQNKKDKSLNDEVAKIIERISKPSNEETIEILEDPVVMSPLLFISESEPEEEAVCTDENMEIINLVDNDVTVVSNETEQVEDNSANATIQKNMEVINSNNELRNIKNEPKEKDESSTNKSMSPKKSIRKSDKPKKLNTNKLAENTRSEIRRSNTELSAAKQLRNRKVQIIKDKEKSKSKTVENTTHKELHKSSEGKAKDISLDVVPKSENKTIDTSTKNSARLTKNGETSKATSKPEAIKERRKSIAETNTTTKEEPTTPSKARSQGLEHKAQAAVKANVNSTSTPTKDSKASVSKSPVRTTRGTANANDGIKTMNIKNMEERQTRRSKISDSEHTAIKSTQKIKKTTQIKKESSMLTIEHEQKKVNVKKAGRPRKSVLIKIEVEKSPSSLNRSADKCVNLNKKPTDALQEKTDIIKTPSSSNKSKSPDKSMKYPVQEKIDSPKTPSSLTKSTDKSVQMTNKAADGGQAKIATPKTPSSLNKNKSTDKSMKINNNPADAVQEKTETPSSLNKCKSTDKCVNLNNKTADAVPEKIETPKTPSSYHKNKGTDKCVNINNKAADAVQEKMNTPKTPQSTITKSSRRTVLSNTPSSGNNKYAISPHQFYKRATRSMQRTTRSAGNTKNKYMLPMSLDMESKVKRKAKVVQNKADNTESASQSKITNPSISKNSHEVISNSNKKDQRPTSQTSVLPMSDYEEMQCGQKLTPSSTTSSEQNLSVVQKNDDFLVPPTPTLLRSVELLRATKSVSDSELAIVPSDNVTPDIVILSSSQGSDGSLSSSQSTQSRRTRVLKRKEQFKKPPDCSNRVNADKKTTPTFSEFLAEQNQRNAAKSPDLFSNCSDIGITCSQMHNDKTTFEGFKIFGSEVKQFQQQYAASSSTKQTSSSRERSCLDLLEKMFDPNAKKSNKNEQQKSTAAVPAATKKSGANKNKPILPAHPVEVITRQGTQQHEKRPSPVDEDVIFEITNNCTFGSMIRVNCNGDVSPVQLQTQKPTQSNKITNYLIGSPTVVAEDDDAQLPRTPSKRPASTNSCNNSGAVDRKRSPKSKHSTQATKLTKWFSKHGGIKQAKNAGTDDDAETADAKKSTRKSPFKRRRLDLTFIK